jgi:LuxR family maltose regulon positive regulatory protein
MPYALFEAKLHSTPVREDWVVRRRLVEQLDQAGDRPVVLVAAPAGFGKTTLLAQWLASSPVPRTTAWVTLDPADEDPVRLWTYLATALERAGCPLGPDPAAFVAANGAAIETRVLPWLLSSMAAMPEAVIVLDDFHFVREQACHDQVAFLVEHLPPHCHVVIATRSDPGLRLGRLRASGQLGEVRAADLAFSADEASALLARQQVRLSGPHLVELVDRTEGWPAGLYLASLSLSGRNEPDEFVRQFSGNDRFIGDYLTEEVLGRQTDDVRDFITTVSILDRLSPSLCDFVAETTGSAVTLRHLERANLFLVPLDGHGQWYRFHHLFAAAARGELAIAHPDRVASLHNRAATWFREHGDIDEAIKHLREAGNTSDAAQLVQAHWMEYVNAGRTATVVGWLRALGSRSRPSDPATAVTAAWMAALSGDEAALAAHLEVLEEFQDYGPLPDGSRSVESAIALIQGLFGFGGPVEMSAGAQRAVELETDVGSPFHAIAHVSLGHAAYVAGDLARAGNFLDKATHNESAQTVVRVLSASTHSLVEAEHGHHDRAVELAELAMDMVETRGLHSLPQASMAFTARALARAATGDLENAGADVDHGLAVRRRNPTLSPWPTMHHLLVAARVAVERGQIPRAQGLLRENAVLMDRYPVGMEKMRARLASIYALMPPVPESVAPEELTEREIEVLRLLQGSLNLNEIAGQLYVSHNTVKTHTAALYRKLGARSRAEAVRIGRICHLV